MRYLHALSFVCGLLVLLSVRPAAAQAPAPMPEDLLSRAPDAGMQSPSDEPPMAPEQRGETPSLPQAPETTVVGRPGAFPQQPLPENTTVSATLTETPKSQVGSSITIITEADIARTQKTQVADVLREVPGLDVVQLGAPGGQTSVFMRGASSQQTKVLIDGIPANDPSSASRGFDFSTLSVDNIQQIEVLRGPQSTLYGSDAMGGVINITTKRGQGPAQLSAQFTGGSYGTAREQLNVSGGGKTAYYSFGASYLQSDGFSSAAHRFGNTEADGVQQGNLSGRYGWTPCSDLDVDYVFRWVNLDAKIDTAGFGDGVPPMDDAPLFIRRNKVLAFVNRVQTRAMTLDGFWEHKIGFSLTDYDRTDTDPGPFGVPHYHGQSRKFDYQGNLALAEWNTFSVGCDYLDEAARSDVDPQFSQTDRGVWFQDQVRVAERWFTTAGFRWDDHSVAGPASTYRLTTLYRLPGPETAFHGSIGTGFRAPSLAEDLFPFGNPNLKPEKSIGWDLGLEQPFADGQFTIDGTYFRNDFTDLIQFDFNTFQVENIGQAMTNGTELTAKWKLSPVVSLSGNYTYTFSEDLATQLPLRRRAPHKGTLVIDRSVWDDRGHIRLACTYVSPRLDSSDGLVYLNEYWLVNLATSYDVNRHFQVLARVDNLLGTYYEEAFGYAASGIAFYGGACLRW